MAHPAHWRVVDGVPTAWFDAPSLLEGAELAGRVLGLSPEAAIDVRPSGTRVRVPTEALTEAVSDAARDLGLTPDPRVLQSVSVVIESPDPSAVRPFWQRALGYEPADDGVLADPLRRDPTFRFRRSAEARPLRNRIHVDVVRPAAEVERADVGPAFGAYGVCHADADGNEVDVVPGGPLGEDAATADWQNVFGAVACYRTQSVPQQRDLAAEAARLADAAGFPLLVDLREGVVILDSGKDQWDAETHGLDADFLELAGNVQSAAHDLGATADLRLPRFVQLFLDAADVGALRTFWARALGYVEDPREGVTDIYDPRRLGPEVVLQPIDTSQTDRLAQRNRLLVEIAVPADRAGRRVEELVMAGGRLLDGRDESWVVADPEGNELAILAG